MARKSKKQSRAEKQLTKTVRTLELPHPTTDLVTEKKLITTAPEIEIRKPATLAQAPHGTCSCCGEEQNAGQEHGAKTSRGLNLSAMDFKLRTSSIIQFQSQVNPLHRRALKPCKDVEASQRMSHVHRFRGRGRYWARVTVPLFLPKL